MNASDKKIINLLSGEVEKFDGLSNFVEKLAGEIQSSATEKNYENASRLAKQLVAIFEVLNKHKSLNLNGPITVSDVGNLKPKIVSYLEQVATDDDGRLSLFSAASVHVDFDTALMGC